MKTRAQMTSGGIPNGPFQYIVHETCGECGARTADYEHFKASCRYCGAYLCDTCVMPGTLDDPEDGSRALADCARCTEEHQ